MPNIVMIVICTIALLISSPLLFIGLEIPFIPLIFFTEKLTYLLEYIVDWLEDSFLSQLVRNNQYLQTAIIGGVAYYSQTILLFLRQRALSKFSSSVTIKNKDPSYNSIVDYIVDTFLKESSGALANTQLVTRKKKKTYKDWVRSWTGTERSEIPTLDIRPNSGSDFHRFTYKDYEVHFYRCKGATHLVGHDRQPVEDEEITLTVWGLNNEPLLALVNEVD